MPATTYDRVPATRDVIRLDNFKLAQADHLQVNQSGPNHQKKEPISIWLQARHVY